MVQISSELRETMNGQQGMEVTWSPTVTNCHSVSLSMSLISSPVKYVMFPFEVCLKLNFLQQNTETFGI